MYAQSQRADRNAEKGSFVLNTSSPSYLPCEPHSVDSADVEVSRTFVFFEKELLDQSEEKKSGMKIINEYKFMSLSGYDMEYLVPITSLVRPPGNLSLLPLTFRCSCSIESGSELFVRSLFVCELLLQLFFFDRLILFLLLIFVTVSLINRLYSSLLIIFVFSCPLVLCLSIA